MPEMPLPVLTQIPYTLDEVHNRAGKNGLRVLSTFSGGGGSSMGYKLAGFDCIGGVEIDPKMAECYQRNLRPEFLFEMPVGEFADDEAKVASIGELDILDGSPPCTSFSIAGDREATWGKKKHFREGQAIQILDALFIDFLRLVEQARPKVVIAENVLGMVRGKAKGYVLEVLRILRELGYDPQLFKLDAARMGVPQRRRRLFFIARRKDLEWDLISLAFDEPEISVRDAIKDVAGDGPKLTENTADLWSRTTPGRSLRDAHPRDYRFNEWVLDPDTPSRTQPASVRMMHWAEPRHMSSAEISRIQSFPEDYDFCSQKALYVCGMSVPPLMMQRLALEIARQWFPDHAKSSPTMEATRG